MILGASRMVTRSLLSVCMPTEAAVQEKHNRAILKFSEMGFPERFLRKTPNHSTAIGTYMKPQSHTICIVAMPCATLVLPEAIMLFLS